MYIGLHMKAREYKKDIAKYRAKHKDYEAYPAEMHNFQNPEVRTSFTLSICQCVQSGPNMICV